MDLPNVHFEGFPIEFKEINPSDFPGFIVENNNKKIIIEPNKKGFINEVFQNQIDLLHKNTVVVNAAVGHGKSTAIINTIKRYYNNHSECVIIVATPFVSLVEQYYTDIHEKAKIPASDIYNYANLGRDLTIDYETKRIHIVTVNTLLGNPGEDGFKNSDMKRKYLNEMIKLCKEQNKKVVFVYDEIHDAIQNFKEEFIFNLWKWRDIILKNYILSATYNEASKIVIEYLAELTDRKIQIIESKRILFPEKQSKLYLHYSPAYNFKSTTPELVQVVTDLINANKNIDILCYSKTLSKSIIKDTEGIGKLLKNKFGIINDCTSELISNQRAINEEPTNRYDNDKCNVGTNFKTGVSIHKNHHAFIIVMPPRASRLWFRNKDGIFSGGINSVIQAMARQRKKGEIHIIMPKPDWFDYMSLMHAGIDEEQAFAYGSIYDVIKHFKKDENLVKYFPLDRQDYLMLLFYKEKLYNNVVDEIDHINAIERDGLAGLSFPEYKSFKLNRGEDYIANSFKFFGEDIAAYLTYSAFTNQFVNCRLEGITYKTTLFFQQGRIQAGLNEYFNKYFSEDYYYSIFQVSNFQMAYIDFRNELFGNFSIKYQKQETTSWANVKQYSNKDFEIQLLRFVALKFYGSENIDRYLEIDIDLPYTRGCYFLDSIKLTYGLNSEDLNLSEDSQKRIKLFDIINRFRKNLLDNIQYHSSHNVEYYFLYNSPPREFLSEENIRLFSIMTSLIQYDPLLQNDVFDLKRGLNIKSLYNRLIEDFFQVVPDRLSTGNRKHVKKIIATKLLPYNSFIDLITPANYHQPTLGIDNYLMRDEEVIRAIMERQNS